MIKRYVAALVVGSLLLSTTAAQVLAPGYGTLDFEPPPANSYQLPPLGVASDGSVLTTSNKEIMLHQLFGDNVTILSFIYTGCSDANGCPLAAHVLNRTLRTIKDDSSLASKVRVVSLSFDPYKDTPERLALYSRWFHEEHPNWLFATTASDAELQPLLDAYGQNRIFELDENGKRSGSFAHSLRVFLIDNEQRIRNIYSVDFLHPDVIVNDVKTLLSEQQGQAIASLSAQHPATSSVKYDTAFTIQLPLRIPLGLPPLPVPDDNALTKAKIELGQKLFFDRRLSLNNTLSCAMCHVPNQGFANNEMATAVGFEGRTVRRNAPTIFNVGYMKLLFHDGRESTLEQQVWQPLLASNEMANPSIGGVLDKIRAIDTYAEEFQQAFNRGPSMETVGQAIAAYQRTLVLGNSPFDRWYYGGDEGAITSDAQAGFELFTGRAGCSNCHQVNNDYALFTDHYLHNTGIGWYQSMRPEPPTYKVQLAPGVFADIESDLINTASEEPPSDLGRYEMTQDPADRWHYRTPSLRNVALTAPYMHNGSLQTLADVVAYYNQGGYVHPQLDELIKPLGLNNEEQLNLVAFLEALTGHTEDLNQHLMRANATPIGDVKITDPHYSNKAYSQK